jgi:hypothetical protein
MTLSFYFSLAPYAQQVSGAGGVGLELSLNAKAGSAGADAIGKLVGKWTNRAVQ